MESTSEVRYLGDLGINLQQIIKRLLANQNLLKLLYYTDKDPLSHPDLTKKQIQEEVVNKLVKIVPRVGSKETAESLIVLKVLRGRPSVENREFQNLFLDIEVFTPLTQWVIKDSNLRPFAIMGEIQRSLNGKNINGLGTITSGGFDLNYLTDELSCHELLFQIISYD